MADDAEWTGRRPPGSRSPWLFEEAPALRGVTVLALGAAGEPSTKLGKWIYWWLLECGAWPEGSFLRNCLLAAGRELRSVAGFLAGRNNRACQKTHDLIAWIALQTRQEVPAATPGAFADPFLLHVTDAEARQAFESVGLLLWQRVWDWAEKEEELTQLVDAGLALDLRSLADYLSSLARLTAEHPLEPEDRHLAGLPEELASEVAKLAVEIE